MAQRIGVRRPTCLIASGETTVTLRGSGRGGRSQELALSAALEIAESMLKNSPQAMALSKEAVWGSAERGYKDALELAWGLLRVHWMHPDFAEGPRAFAEKREPRWNPDPNAQREELG